ncbi:hypothetical protein OF83DRAFT_1088706 [Amylostereum chailletii]|nr:hypothetical protein OF83DRAFT_1088706 [Amylostereum chailletii]
MSTPTIHHRGRPSSPFFRHRPLGRAPSPPTWACYEQIHASSYTDSDSDGSFSEHDDDDDDEHDEDASDSEDELGGLGGGNDAAAAGMDAMDIADGAAPAAVKDKGKGKAVDASDEKVQARARERKERARIRRQPVVALRPILTIQRSQGFVWNQDLFVPPYIKDRYVASTSPPNASGFVSTSVSSTHSALTDYEIEVVEIRVRDDELKDIIP